MSNNQKYKKMEKNNNKTAIANTNTEFLDFEKAKVQTLTLDQLKRTHMENDILGHPLKGMYHYQIIEACRDIAMSHGLKLQIEEIFAAQNRDRSQPGVVILPEVEKTYGYKAVEAHVLRRVYANIRILDFDTDEFTSNLAIAFHQDGVQIAFGTMVKICHNQCILGADRIISNYGKNKKNFNEMCNEVNIWMENCGHILTEEQEKINRMKAVTLTPAQVLQTIGELTAIRVAHDTSVPEIRIRETYPLSQTQICAFTEMLLVKQKQQGHITMWDVYNSATELYKADKMEIPNVLPQNAAMNNFIDNWMQNN